MRTKARARIGLKPRLLIGRKSRLVMLANVNTSYFTGTRETSKQRTTEMDKGDEKKGKGNLDVQDEGREKKERKPVYQRQNRRAIIAFRARKIPRAETLDLFTTK